MESNCIWSGGRVGNWEEDGFLLLPNWVREVRATCQFREIYAAARAVTDLLVSQVKWCVTLNPVSSILVHDHVIPTKVAIWRPINILLVLSAQIKTALRLHGGCSRAYKRPKAQSPQEKTGAKDEHGIRGRGGGAFSRNGLALISLSVGGRVDMGERERNRPKTLSSYGV